MGMILENKAVFSIEVFKNTNNKKHAPKLIFFNEKKVRKIQIILT
jgi:hypothetical protein